jgi:hypothetical protein
MYRLRVNNQFKFVTLISMTPSDVRFKPTHLTLSLTLDLDL